MPIQVGDFTIALNFSGLSGTIESVIGKPATLSILFSNNSQTDRLYNLSLDITLPDGVSYVSSSHIPTTSVIDSNFNNVITFVNIKDLYSNELNYAVSVDIQIDEYLRSDPTIPVDFLTVFSNLLFTATADTKPRGSLDIGNELVSASSIVSATAYQYSVVFIGPTRYLKGAGETSDSAFAGDQIFDATIKIENNTRESSNVNCNIDLANGIRYVGDWTATGDDALEFSNPNIVPPAPLKNFTNINILDIDLQAGSSNEISFKASIWNKFTDNGLENSGSEIMHGDILESQVYLESFLQYQYSYLSMEALILIFFKTLVSPITDWNKTNQFSISYTTSSYLGVNFFSLTNLIPDGMTFIESVPEVTTSVDNGDGTTSVTWNLGNLGTSAHGTIDFSLLTNTTYFDGTQIVSTDNFISTLTGNFTHPTLGTFLTDSISKILSIATPNLSKELIGYYDKTLTEKSVDCGTVGDFIKFKITYDASNIDATQKDVFLFDYPALNMVMTEVPHYTISQDFPTDAVFELVPDNGLMIGLRDISGGTYFEIEFEIEVTHQEVSKIAKNLAKVSLVNKNHISTSIRDFAEIKFGTPNLKYTPTLSGPDCFVLSSNFDYELEIKNVQTQNHLNVSDAFNIVSETIIADIFTISNLRVTSTSGADFQSPTLNNSTINFIINKLPANEIITLKFSIISSKLPSMGENYEIKHSLTQGTSQSDKSSFEYTLDNLEKTEIIIACFPAFTKLFSKSIIDAGELFTTELKILIPRGLTAFNLELTDELTTSSIEHIDNIQLNGAPITNHSITNEILTIPIVQNLDSSNSDLEYTITYTDAIYDISPINHEDKFTKTAIINWNTDSENTTAKSLDAVSDLLVLSPEVKIDKYQRNHTKATLFSKTNLASDLNDTILYKLRLENIGKSPSYNIVVTDVLDPDLTFIKILVGTGTFDTSNNTVTIRTDKLLPGYYTEFLIETKVNNTIETEIALNDATVSYALSLDKTDVFDANTSNEVVLLEEIFNLKKEQRNTTLNTDFTVSSLSVIKGQTFQYRITLENFSDTILTNVSITDKFPDNVEFLSFEPFSNGTLSISNNVVTTNISVVNSNELISFTYNLRLNIDTLKRKSSYSTILFSTPSDSKIFTLDSNVLYTSLAALGRGFDVY